MKIDKSTKKELEKQIKAVAKQSGYKHCDGSLFQQNGDAFISWSYVVVNSSRIVYRVSIKKYSYDDIFWDIINMSDNKTAPLSLRAIGAFAAPDLTVASGEIPLSTDIVGIANSLCNIVAGEVSTFLKANNINDYILSDQNSPYHPALKALALLDSGDVITAISYARSRIESGDRRGGFENEGKGFFEWLLYRYDNPDHGEQ